MILVTVLIPKVRNKSVVTFPLFVDRSFNTLLICECMSFLINEIFKNIQNLSGSKHLVRSLYKCYKVYKGNIGFKKRTGRIHKKTKN